MSAYMKSKFECVCLCGVCLCVHVPVYGVYVCVCVCVHVHAMPPFAKACTWLADVFLSIFQPVIHTEV